MAEENELESLKVAHCWNFAIVTTAGVLLLHYVVSSCCCAAAKLTSVWVHVLQSVMCASGR